MRTLILILILIFGAIACDRQEFGGRDSGGILEPPKNSSPDPVGGNNSDNNFDDGSPGPPQLGGFFGVALINEASALGFETLGSHRSNVLYSPYSTAQKAAALRALNDGDTSYGYALKELDSEIEGTSTMFFKASVWIHESVTPANASLLVEMGVEARLVDFKQAETARQRINNYYREVSAGKVTVALSSPLSPDTEIGLVDVSFFQDSWAQPFDANRTAPSRFFGFNSEFEVQMMEVEGSFQVQRTEAFDAVILPYEGGATLTVIVPKDGEFDSVQALLGPTFLDSVAQRSTTEFVQINLPKIDLDIRSNELASAELGDWLAGEPNFNLSSAQRASISFDESMTIAQNESAPEDPSFGTPPADNRVVESIRVDRPFFFAIRDARQIPVLQGQIARID